MPAPDVLDDAAASRLLLPLSPSLRPPAPTPNATVPTSLPPPSAQPRGRWRNPHHAEAGSGLGCYHDSAPEGKKGKAAPLAWEMVDMFGTRAKGGDSGNGGVSLRRSRSNRQGRPDGEVWDW